MKATVILAHPYEKSFNHAIFHQVVTTLDKLKVSVYAHDLYQEQFDPVLSKEELGKAESQDPLVRQYTVEMVDSALLVFIHPNWWGQPPAIMKGYIDRVFRPPFAYDFPQGDSGGGAPIPKLGAKTGLVFNTSNTPAEREIGVFKDPLEAEWIDCVFGFCGITKAFRKTFRVVSESDAAIRADWLEEVRDITKKHCP